VDEKAINSAVTDGWNADKRREGDIEKDDFLKRIEQGG
jgi:hypothetical protein